MLQSPIHVSGVSRLDRDILAGLQSTDRKLWIAVDIGLIINPGGVRNQVKGGAIQAASVTPKEAVWFDRSRIISDAWEHCLIFKFSEAPEVEIAMVLRPAQPAVGDSEAAYGTVATIMPTTKLTSARLPSITPTGAGGHDSVCVSRRLTTLRTYLSTT